MAPSRIGRFCRNPWLGALEFDTPQPSVVMVDRTTRLSRLPPIQGGRIRKALLKSVGRHALINPDLIAGFD